MSVTVPEAAIWVNVISA